MALPGPLELTGRSYGLESVLLCYSTSGNAHIREVTMYASDATGAPPTSPIFSDFTVRTGTNCDRLEVNRAVDNAVGMVVRMEGGSDTIRLEGLVVTWVDESLGVLAQDAPAAPDPASEN
jgi:hypothetical protein